MYTFNVGSIEELLECVLTQRTDRNLVDSSILGRIDEHNIKYGFPKETSTQLHVWTNYRGERSSEIEVTVPVYRFLVDNYSYTNTARTITNLYYAWSDYMVESEDTQTFYWQDTFFKTPINWDEYYPETLAYFALRVYPKLVSVLDKLKPDWVHHDEDYLQEFFEETRAGKHRWVDLIYRLVKRAPRESISTEDYRRPDNTYNYESLISQDINSCSFLYEDTWYTALRIHQGADARWGYTLPICLEEKWDNDGFVMRYVARAYLYCTECQASWYSDDAGYRWRIGDKWINNPALESNPLLFSKDQELTQIRVYDLEDYTLQLHPEDADEDGEGRGRCLCPVCEKGVLEGVGYSS